MMRFLYRTSIGRFTLKCLVSPKISRVCGRFLSSSISRWMIPMFIRKHRIDMNEIVLPPGGFTSFNDFFIRRRLQRLEPAFADDTIISPCDGLLTILPIWEDTRLAVKGTVYRLDRLLRDSQLAEDLRGGMALIFRLTPQHYHRYCYSVNGTILWKRRIEGKLHSVRPLALEKVPVFVENSREFQVIKTVGGLMVQMEVGALLVGRIMNHPREDRRCVRAGEEKGYFEFGGSTVILLLKKHIAELTDEFKIDGNKEIPVRMGQLLGRI